MTVELFRLVVLFWLICASTLPLFAASQKKHAGIWFLLGTFFGPFAWIAIFVVLKVDRKPAN